MSVYCFLKLVMISRSHNFLGKKKKKKPCKLEKRKSMCAVLSVGLLIFKIFTTMLLSNVTQKLKTTLNVISKVTMAFEWDCSVPLC